MKMVMKGAFATCRGQIFVQPRGRLEEQLSVASLLFSPAYRKVVAVIVVVNRGTQDAIVGHEGGP